MKTQVDKATLSHIITFCDHAKHLQWSDSALTAMVHDQLGKLGERCKKKTHQDKATISASAADIVAMGTLTNAFGHSASVFIIREYFLNPLLKQLK